MNNLSGFLSFQAILFTVFPYVTQRPWGPELILCSGARRYAVAVAQVWSWIRTVVKKAPTAAPRTVEMTALILLSSSHFKFFASISVCFYHLILYI